MNGRRASRSVIAAAITIAAGVAVGASGCAAAPLTPPAPLPTGLSIDLYQTRLDVADRMIEISIANDSGADLTITQATLTSDQFSEPSHWAPRAGGTLVRAGFAVDLPVALPPVACDSDSPRHLVTLEFKTADGRTGTTTVDTTERYDQLVQLRDQDCLAAAVGAVATLSMAIAPSITTIADAEVIVLPLVVTPTGDDGAIEIRSVGATVLLAMADPITGEAVDAVALDRSVSGTDPERTIDLLVRPGRCDPHAVAEDKQGTVFTVEVTAPDGQSGTIVVRADDAVKTGIYDAIATICGFPQG